MNKQKFLFTLICLLGSMILNAQDFPAATLQHGDNLKVFYGSDAMKLAYNEAVDGDEITLSSGIFSVLPHISKHITIRGAGYVQNEKVGRFATYIDGSQALTIESALTVTVEGVCFIGDLICQGKNINIKKCDISRLSCLVCENLLVDQCRIVYCNLQNAYIKNSIIRGLDADNTSIENCTFNVDLEDAAGIQPSAMSKCNIRNSIFDYWGTNNSVLVNNVIGIDLSIGWDENYVEESNQTESNYYLDQQDYQGLFQNDMYWIAGNEYPLTSAAAATYLGTDGTQVGAHGGYKPFSNVPTNPQVVYRYVAPESDKEGKLPVKFIIEAQQ